MKVGHINLARSFNGTGEHFVGLIEALDRQGVEQHVIVRNTALAQRVALYERTSVGPTTGSPVVAYCLMPAVDIVHIHDEDSGQAGLLLTLTRSMPYVLTRRSTAAPARNPVNRSVYRRAARVICTSAGAADSLLAFDAAVKVVVLPDIARQGHDDIEMHGQRIAAEHMRIFRKCMDSSRIPALLL